MTWDMRCAFRRRFEALAGIGRDPQTGGYERYAWTASDAAAAGWFVEQSNELGLEAEADRNGNRWAWWWPDGSGSLDAIGDRQAVVTGSHLDTVPQGGAYDGALGVVCAFTAIEALTHEGFRPSRPLAVVAFADEEGARYNTPCFGSGLSTGALRAIDVLERRDNGDVKLADALSAAGIDPDRIGPDHDRLGRLGAFVELHIEQGKRLAYEGEPVAVGTGIWPHGRWRLTFTGEGNHAGTTRMADRRDPMQVLPATLLTMRDEALATGAVATIGRLTTHPGGTNTIAGRVTAWLDARARDEPTLQAVVEAVADSAAEAAERAGVDVDIAREAFASGVAFDAGLRQRMVDALEHEGLSVPALATAAGHDAGTLASKVPTGMLYVRNPTGVSHSPAEHADPEDCLTGVRALAAVLRVLA